MSTHCEMRLIGSRMPAFLGALEKTKILEYVKALGLTNPLYVDEDYARGLGFRSSVVPLGFVTSMTLQSRDLKFSTFGLDEKRTLAGEWSWLHSGIICASDILSGQSVLTDVGRKVGRVPMATLVIETTFVNQFGEHALTMKETLLERET